PWYSAAYFGVLMTSQLKTLCFRTLIIPRPLIPTLFPYTTLFRSFPRSKGAAAPCTCTPEPPRPRRRWRARTCAPSTWTARRFLRSEEHTSELQSRENLVCRLLLEKKKTKT